MWVQLYICEVLLITVIFLILTSLELELATAVIDTTKKNFDQCWDFKCQLPRRERVRLADVVNTKSEGRVVPTDIMLYRCRGSVGCCDNINESCTVSKKMHACIKFQLEDGGLTDKFVIAPNHTECSCKEMDAKEAKRLERELDDEKYNMLDSCAIS